MRQGGNGHHNAAPRHQGGAGGAGGNGGVNQNPRNQNPQHQNPGPPMGMPPSVQAELMWMKQEAAQVRAAVIALEQEKDSLRKAIRKLKLENVRVRQKVKRLQETVNDLRGVPNDAGSDVDLTELDYDEIGHNFLLVGGIQDPLSSSYEIKIKDDNQVEHKSAERLYWYKIAEHFRDEQAKKKIIEATTADLAENAVKGIQNYNEKIWNDHRVDAWRDAQKLKFDQHRDILNLLVLSKGIYVGVASHDKFFGTGWRKNREEANKPAFWDGENQGGKILMRLRDDYLNEHTWESKEEEENSEKKFNHNRRFVWRRVEQQKRGPPMLVGPQPLIVRTGLAARRGTGAWVGRRGGATGGGILNYGTPMATFFPNTAPMHPPPPQQWNNPSQKKTGGNGGGH